MEAAVCYALGEEHCDSPSCVGNSVRNVKIDLNDQSWSSKKARAKGLRKLAIAQLGSRELDQAEFDDKLEMKTIKVFVPWLLSKLKGAKKFQKEINSLINKLKRYKERKGQLDVILQKMDELYSESEIEFLTVDFIADFEGLIGMAPCYYQCFKLKRDEFLAKGAEIVLSVLKDMKSPGCKYL